MADASVTETTDIIQAGRHRLGPATASSSIPSSSPPRFESRNISSASSTCTTNSENHIAHRRKAVGGLRPTTHGNSGSGPTLARSPSHYRVDGFSPTCEPPLNARNRNLRFRVCSSFPLWTNLLQVSENNAIILLFSCRIHDGTQLQTRKR